MKFLLQILFYFGLNFNAFSGYTQHKNPDTTDWAFAQIAQLNSQRAFYQECLKSNLRLISDIRFFQKTSVIKDSAEFIRRLTDYLFQLQYIAISSVKAQLDSALMNGIMKFQEDNGLVADGKISITLIRRLKLPLEKLIHSIDFSLSQISDLDSISSTSILVNIPDYKLYLFHKGVIIKDIDVIVGSSKHPTKKLSAEMDAIIFRPYWYVPKSIFQNELMPAIKKDPDYLTRNKMEWFGSGVRQLPGEHNALGVVKFLIPNRFGIYLHDTPVKSLFGKRNRPFSHGCIRLKEAIWLSEFILTVIEEWQRDRYDKLWKEGDDRKVNLSKTIPVRIVYLTAWFSSNGRFQWRNDVYAKERTGE